MDLTKRKLDSVYRKLPSWIISFSFFIGSMYLGKDYLIEEILFKNNFDATNCDFRWPCDNLLIEHNVTKSYGELIKRLISLYSGSISFFLVSEMFWISNEMRIALKTWLSWFHVFLAHFVNYFLINIHDKTTSTPAPVRQGTIFPRGPRCNGIHYVINNNNL